MQSTSLKRLSKKHIPVRPTPACQGILSLSISWTPTKTCRLHWGVKKSESNLNLSDLISKSCIPYSSTWKPIMKNENPVHVSRTDIAHKDRDTTGSFEVAAASSSWHPKSNTITTHNLPWPGCLKSHASSLHPSLSVSVRHCKAYVYPLFGRAYIFATTSISTLTAKWRELLHPSFIQKRWKKPCTCPGINLECKLDLWGSHSMTKHFRIGRVRCNTSNQFSLGHYRARLVGIRVLIQNRWANIANWSRFYI